MPFEHAFQAATLINRLDRLSRSNEAKGGLNPAQWEALRYVAQANRFSRTPAALAEYLGATRGTISQTLIALEQKGHVTRQPSTRDKRSITLALTPAGSETLARDPLLDLAHDLAEALPGKLEDLVEALRATLSTLIRRNGGRAFGACFTCRHFRPGKTLGATPHHCMLLDEPLSDTDSRAICVEQEPTAAD
ncbi:MAG: MarR family transcriptional regulator [Rhizobiales bacterium]|nr:MarR family transcriptional regulator [Hyphomicrobiales bacterium]